MVFLIQGVIGCNVYGLLFLFLLRFYLVLWWGLKEICCLFVCFGFVLVEVMVYFLFLPPNLLGEYVLVSVLGCLNKCKVFCFVFRCFVQMFFNVCCIYSSHFNHVKLIGSMLQLVVLSRFRWGVGMEKVFLMKCFCS